MKKKIIAIFVVGFVLSGLMTASNSYASINYIRVPATLEISTELFSPDIFVMLEDNFSELGCVASASYWNVVIEDSNNNWYWNNGWTIPNTNLQWQNDFMFYPDLIGYDFIRVFPICCFDDFCSNFVENDMSFEGGTGETIFSVVAGVPTGGLPLDNVRVASGSVATIVGYGQSILDNLGSIWALVIGLPLGFWFITRVIKLVKAKDEKN